LDSTLLFIYGIFESLRKHVEDRWYELIIISELEKNYFAFQDCTSISNGFLSVIINIYMTASFFIWLFPQNVFQMWSILTYRYDLSLENEVLVFPSFI